MFNQNILLQKIKDDYNLIAEHFSQTRHWPWPEFSDFKPYLKNGQRVLDLGCGNGRLYFSFLKDLNLEYHGIDVSERLIEIANQKKNEKAEIASQNVPTCHSWLEQESRGDKSINNALDSRFRGNDRGEATSAVYKPIFNVGELTNILYEDNYFDVVLCIAAFHHLPSKHLRLKALSEMNRVLKPGGCLLMTNWYWWQPLPWRYFFNKMFWKNCWNDLFIPWKNQKGEVITDLYYHAFTRSELRELIDESGLIIEKLYLINKEKKTKKKSRINLIVIAKK